MELELVQRLLRWQCQRDMSKYLIIDNIIILIDTKNLNRDIAEQLILTPQWALAMRHIFKDSLGKETTPLREMIRKMPGISLTMRSIWLHANNVCGIILPLIINARRM